MLRLIAVLAFAAVLVGSCCDCQQCVAQFDPNAKMEGKIGYNAQRVSDLPTGLNRLQLWVVVAPNFASIPRERAVAEMFTGGPDGKPTDPRLRQLREGCAWNYYFSNDPLFAKSELVKAVGTATPIVCLTGPDGRLIAEDGGRGVFVNAASCPASAGEMADLLYQGADQLNPRPKFEGTHSALWGEADPCPGPYCPTPGPETPTPIVEPSLPSIVPNRNVVSSRWLLPLGGLIAVGAVSSLIFLLTRQSDDRLT